MTIIRSVLELFGITYLRFRTIPRIWCVWLVGVNASCLFFIGHVEAQVVLAVTGIAVILQALIYQRHGFVRILGSVHLMWIPMFAWLGTRVDQIGQHETLSAWLTLLFATNAVSFIIDAIDGYRYANGETAPHYHWART